MSLQKIIDYPLWHPCSQMKDYEIFQPLRITGAHGAYLELQNGTKIIDAISSWWCKSLGHNHPRLKKSLMQQVEKFEHVILANTINETILNLSNKLTGLTQSLKKIQYASDGSSVVEIALKMSLHSRLILNQQKRTQFIALKNGFHGETCGALSVSDLGLYKTPYEKMLFQTYFIDSIPYVSNMNDPVWHDCSSEWEHIEKKLMPYENTATALILEPILQGAGGMKIYSQDLLKKLRNWTRKNNIHLIADEIMTGLGRTGKIFACEHANIEPDFLCLSKGLTAGFLPMSAMLTTNDIYDLFYDDYEKNKFFLHSHTHSGNALSASVAIEVLNIIQSENLCHRAHELGKIMSEKMNAIANQTNKLKNIRWIGGVAAADLNTEHSNRRLGYEVYQKAVQLGALLRPLGNTIYWLPPLNVGFSVIDALADITKNALLSVTWPC